MKHKSSIAVMLLAIGSTLLISCDPDYGEYLCIRNTSSHEVTFIPSNRVTTTSIEDTTTIVYESKSYTIDANDDVSIYIDGGLGGASLEHCRWSVENKYYNDSVILRFDDGRQVVYHRNDTTGISPYNFNSSLYGYEEHRRESAPFKNHPSYGRLTFSITDEHYAAALAE